MPASESGLVQVCNAGPRWGLSGILWGYIAKNIASFGLSSLVRMGN